MDLVEEAKMELYLAGEEKAPVVLICPGGGYAWRSPREAAPVAKAFNAQGIHAAVLKYEVENPPLRLRPLWDVSSAMMTLRRRAEEWKIDTEEIYLCGFSAGGHLAASFGVFWQDSAKFKEGTDCQLHKPNGLILCYPVISAGKYAHQGSFANLAGEQEDWEAFSLEHRVTEQVPPTFLWHTITDNSVPVQNSLLFAEQLIEKQVPCELLLFPKGRHGLSLATKEVEDQSNGRVADEHVARWFEQCVDWVKMKKEKS